MSYASAPGGSTGRRPLMAVVAIIGVLAIIVGILYIADASILPHFMVAGSHVKKGSHLIRGIVAIVVGAVLMLFAWMTGRRR